MKKAVVRHYVASLIDVETFPMERGLTGKMMTWVVDLY